MRTVRVDPTDVRTIELAHHLAHATFGPTLRYGRYRRAIARGRDVLWVVRDVIDPEVAGYLDVFPLCPAAAADLVAGRLVEEDLDAPHLVAPHELRRDEGLVLYVGGIAVRAVGTILGARRANSLVSALVVHTSMLAAQVNGLTVVASAATGPGRALIDHGGGELLVDGSQRRDGMPCYRLADLSTRARD